MSEADSRPAVPKNAATIIVARDAQGGAPEIFLVQRHKKIGFMGGMHVFPGGKLTDDDSSPEMRPQLVDDGGGGLADAWADDVSEDTARALSVTAIRETFEEAGVLLAEVEAGRDLSDMRRRLLDGEKFSSLLQEHGLRLRLGVLQPMSRWITPSMEPKRFDTRFYLARAPRGQLASHDQQETVAGKWLTATSALAESRQGSIRLAPPTMQSLKFVEKASSVEAMIELARAQAKPPCIDPIVITQGDELVILFPGDPDHPTAERALPGPTRRVLQKLDRKKEQNSSA